MPRSNQAEPALLPTSPLLSTEFAEDFDRIRDAFVQQIKPRGMIDHMHALDIAELTLEISQRHPTLQCRDPQFGAS